MIDPHCFKNVIIHGALVMAVGTEVYLLKPEIIPNQENAISKYCSLFLVSDDFHSEPASTDYTGHSIAVSSGSTDSTSFSSGYSIRFV
ncbi:MAG: hypothetical protein ABR936_04560 [Bacteroidota bacterium]|jgi:hypothetical protein